MEKPTKPYDNKRIFWDVNAEQLDFERYASFIIERVFERGDVEDIRMCRRYYGDERIITALTKAKFLMDHTTYLVSILFDKPLTDFRCYLLRQQNPMLYPY